MLAEWDIQHRGAVRKIQILHGDLSQLPPEHFVDVLVVSAFRNQYGVTATSLIGSLFQHGISVRDLAEAKQLDMTSEFSCWLSHRVPESSGFKHLLCLESGWRGQPPEIVDDLFRGLVPLFVTTFPEGSVAMPILGAGDQHYPAMQMLELMLRSAVAWVRRGLAISVMKIVIYSDQVAELAVRKFREVQEQESPPGMRGATDPVVEKGRLASTVTSGHDLFISYSHEDAQSAKMLQTMVLKARPGAKIFYDRQVLRPGISWLMTIAESLDGSARVAPLFTPHYWSSNFCKDEFAAALARQQDTGEQVLFPIYLRSAKIPYLFRNIQFADCREDDASKFSDACSELCRSLG